MSYDVSVRLPIKTEKKIYITLPLNEEPNITWNVKELILHSSGWDIQNEQSNGNIKTWINKIYQGKLNLLTYPEKFKKYESPNGYGTISGVLRFYSSCINMYLELENYCSKYYSTEETVELFNVAIVWVD